MSPTGCATGLWATRRGGRSTSTISAAAPCCGRRSSSALAIFSSATRPAPASAGLLRNFPGGRTRAIARPASTISMTGSTMRRSPVDLAPHAYCPVSVSGMEDAAWTERTQRAVLLQADPIEQAAIYFNYCRGDLRRPTTRWTAGGSRDWHFATICCNTPCLPTRRSSFRTRPWRPKCPAPSAFCPSSRSSRRPAEALTSILSHLTGQSRGWPMLDEAIDLARQDHLAAVAAELGRPMDRARRRRKMPVVGPGESVPERLDPNLRREAFERLTSFGVDPRYFASLAGAASADPHAFAAQPARHRG